MKVTLGSAVVITVGLASYTSAAAVVGPVATAAPRLQKRVFPTGSADVASFLATVDPAELSTYFSWAANGDTGFVSHARSFTSANAEQYSSYLAGKSIDSSEAAAILGGIATATGSADGAAATGTGAGASGSGSSSDGSGSGAASSGATLAPGATTTDANGNVIVGTSTTDANGSVVAGSSTISTGTGTATGAAGAAGSATSGAAGAASTGTNAVAGAAGSATSAAGAAGASATGGARDGAQSGISINMGAVATVLAAVAAYLAI